MDRILLIDDDKNLLRVTAFNLKTAGFDIVTAASGRDGFEQLQKSVPDLVITDVKLGDMNGLELMEKIKNQTPDVPVIVITAYGSIDMAVKAMKHGAFNFIPKPFERETLRRSCVKAIELANLKAQNRLLSEEVGRLTGTHGMATVNPTMKALLDKAHTVAGSDATVLITGESGTGKEVLARLIHQQSSRNKNPMVAINCAAIPETLIESELFGHTKGAFTGATTSRKGKFLAAHGGTLFLDEISELKPDMQAKLLRALQEREIEPVGSERKEAVDIRIVSASNKDLPVLIGQKRFRDDLFYRLSVVPLHLPPLRERKEDIPALTGHFLKKLKAPAKVRFGKAALTAMEKYSWPGNIRELENTVERSVILRKADLIDREDLNLPPPGTGIGKPHDFQFPDEGISLEAVERDLIKKALEKSGGNRSEAARLLKIPRHVLIYRLEKFGI